MYLHIFWASLWWIRFRMPDIRANRGMRTHLRPARCDGISRIPGLDAAAQEGKEGARNSAAPRCARF